MDPYVGEIRIFAGSYAPAGWELCNGQLLPVAEYEALFSLLGTVYGGDGATTFGLPDLRGRAPLSFGQGPSLSGYALGAKGGAETVTLTADELAAHTHVLAANTTAATAANPAGNVPAVASVTFYTPAQAAGIVVSSLAGASVDTSGGGGSHDNNMPSVPLNFIIATQGLYPQPS